MATATAAQLTQISNLYVSLFNRAPDTAGLSFWSSALANGASISTITQGFLTAPEGQANYPQFQSAPEFVTAFYTKVFGRAPDASGLAFWTAALNGAGGANSDAAKAAVVAQIVDVVSTPLSSRPAGLTDAQYAQTVSDRALFANKVELGVYAATLSTVVTGTDAGQAGALLTGITADASTVANAKALILNTGFAAAVTGNTAYVGSQYGDVFSTAASALQAAASTFSLDGGAGSDALYLTNKTGGVVNVTDTVKNVSNVEAIYVTGTTGADVTNVAAGKFVGATTLGAWQSNGAVNFTGLAAGQGAAVNGSPAASSFGYVAGATAAALAISGGTSGAVTLTGAGLNSAAITSSGATANVANVDLAGTISTVSINAATALTSTLTGGKLGSALSISGGGAVNLGTLPAAFATVNASASTGGLTATIGTALTSLTGSSAVDKITVAGALAAGVTISLGDGNDALLAGGGSIAAGSTVDAGAGIDTLSSSLVTAANASVFKNFELLQIEQGSITDASLLTGSSLTGLVLAGGNGAGAVNNVASTVGLTVTGAVNGGTTTIGVKDAATNTADVYTITLAHATANNGADAGTIGLAGVETVNVVSAGTVGAGNKNFIDISDAALKSLVITGSQAVQIGFSTATTATSLIDGSAATGSLTLDTTNVVAATVANGGLTVKGGTAADSLTIAQAATVTGGAGNDVFVLSSAALQQAASPTVATIASKLVTITDFARGDVIDFVGAVAGTAGTAITFADQSSAADLLAAVTAVTTGNAAATIEAFRFGGDTYIVADLGGFGTFGAGDTLVKLSGIVDLANVHANATTGEVFFAA